jgi:hypothetical protein
MTRLNSRLQKLEGPKKVLPRIISVLKVIYNTGPDGPVASDDAYATIPGFDLPTLKKSRKETLVQFEHRVEQISDEAFATESLDQAEAQTAIKALKGKIEQANLHAKRSKQGCKRGPQRQVWEGSGRR